MNNFFWLTFLKCSNVDTCNSDLVILTDIYYILYFTCGFKMFVVGSFSGNRVCNINNSRSPQYLHIQLLNSFILCPIKKLGAKITRYTHYVEGHHLHCEVVLTKILLVDMNIVRLLPNML